MYTYTYYTIMQIDVNHMEYKIFNLKKNIQNVLVWTHVHGVLFAP